MRRLLFPVVQLHALALGIGAAWLLACGGGSPTAPTAATPPGTAAATSPARLRVVTWNLQHGYSVDKRHVNQEQITFLASLHPDVVALQELAEWDNNMPAIYRDGLAAATGRPWTFRYEPDLPSAPVSSRGGSALASTLTVASQAVLRLDDPLAPADANRNRAAIRFSIVQGTTRVDVATTHLDFIDATDRRSQLDRVQAWLAGGAASRLVAGDFNAEPDDGQTWAAWQSEYADAWLLPANPLRQSPGWTMLHRSTTGKPGRIDYQWVKGLEPVAVEVVQTDLSDHYALVVDYAIGGGK